MSRALAEHAGASFREDAPRPPVPGEEGEASRCNPGRAARMRGQSRAKDSPPGSRRRNEDGLGEPEGSASPDWPLGRWTKSLHFLLGDQDGARLFRTFLERDERADTLDFWFACNGFRQMDLKDAKTLRVAKAIFKRYVDNKSVVSRQLKPATKTFIRDSVKKQQIDSAMFDQAQLEVQSHMEEEAYQTFLTSDIYLDYVRTGCENAAYVSHPLGSLKLMCGYLPPLLEEEEWSCGDLKAKSLGAVVGLSAKSLRASAAVRTAAEVLETSCRSRREPCSPYLLSSGYVLAPASSANDSEVSSDLTDDSTSMTDSSADGIPPYKVGTKKQLQREMHRSVKINGQITLPHFPRTHRLPKEMTPVEPSAFAAQLIARLEKLQRERDSMSSLEERLQQMQEEEEREESAELLGSSLQNPLLCAASQGEEDPQAILDEHLSRVLKTPGCQSPGASRRSPRSGSPDRPRPLGPPLGAYHRASTKHIHHHHIHHHHAAPRSREQLEAEAAQRVQHLCPLAGVARPDLSPAQARRSVTAGGEGLSSPRLPLDAAQRSQNVWQWILESERQGKHKPHSAQGLKKPGPLEPSRTHPPWGGAAALRGHHPGHPFLQDPAMPPLPPPNTLAQLEEACRRLEEVSKPPKQRQPAAPSLLQRDRSLPASVFSAAGGPFSTCAPPADESKELVVTYFFCGEEIPYRSVMKTHGLTLGLFKDQLSKKGNYRYYFKKASDEFECGAVFQEVREDAAVLPVYEGKVLGKVERVE